jgi:hypothetical protein
MVNRSAQSTQPARGYDEDDTDPAVIETEDFEELLELVLF